MAILRGFDLPEDLHYLVDKHVWVRPLGGGLARVGLTPVAYHLLRHSLEAISVMQSQLGQEVPKGKSVAMVESVKYIGPVPAPFTGVVVRGNPAALADPSIAERDPYGEGWIVEMSATDWESAAAGLVTGAAAMKAYLALLEAQNIDSST
jgi:glycine cleavage system H protein